MKEKCIIPSNNISPHDLSQPAQTNLIALFTQWRGKIARYSMFAAVPALLAPVLQNVRAGETAGQDFNIASRRSMPAKSWWRSSRSGRLPLATGAAPAFTPATGNDNCPGKPIPLGSYTAASPYVDTGDTTGANSTVSYLYFYYYVQYSQGPDQVYSFTLTGVGANPQIEVIASDPNSYKPLVSIASGYYGYSECTAGTDHYLYYPLYDDTRSGGDGIVQLNNLPLNKRVFLYIDSQLNDSQGSGAYTIKLQDVTVGDGPSAVPFDFDGNTTSDASIFRPSESNWYSFQQEGSPTSGGTHFGLATDKLVPGDYDDDGITDIAVFRAGDWWWINSTDSTVSVVQFGLAGDTPVPADYTGDGRDEIAIYRNGVWWRLNLADYQVTATQFGLASDKPVPADYDGDRKKDLAIYRDGTWWILKSTGGYSVQQWGLSTDKLVPEDYDGDGRTDLAVYRNGDWYVLKSSGGFDFYHWGSAADTPVPGKYSAYYRTQPAYYRDGMWGILFPGGGTTTFSFGQIGDQPVPASYLR